MKFLAIIIITTLIVFINGCNFNFNPRYAKYKKQTLFAFNPSSLDAVAMEKNISFPGSLVPMSLNAEILPKKNLAQYDEGVISRNIEIKITNKSNHPIRVFKYINDKQKRIILAENLTEERRRDRLINTGMVYQDLNSNRSTVVFVGTIHDFMMFSRNISIGSLAYNRENFVKDEIDLVVELNSNKIKSASFTNEDLIMSINIISNPLYR